MKKYEFPEVDLVYVDDVLTYSNGEINFDEMENEGDMMPFGW